MAYSSDINLPLAQEPKTSDMNVWPDFLDVYNSIHILAQLVDRVRQGSGDAGTKPWDAMPFERWFYAPAREKITAGNIVTAVNVRARNSETDEFEQYTGIVKGGPIYAGENFSARSENGQFNTPSQGTGLIGFALADCEQGELCKVGVGPAIAKIEGVKMGDTIMAYNFLAAPGGGGFGFFFNVTNKEELRGLVVNSFLPHAATVVGWAVADDAVMITPWLDYAAYLAARTAWDTPYIPEAGNS